MDEGPASSAPEVPPRHNVLGVGISVLTLDKAASFLIQSAQAGVKGYVTITGVHGVMESQRDEALKKIHNNSLLSTPDGMPMVWMGKINGHKAISRVYGPELMAEICRRSVESGQTHYLYGGGDGVVEKLKSKLEEKFPGIRIVGTMTPPFRPLNEEERSSLKGEISRLRPDFFWVGLSTPKQERFMSEYLPQLDAKIMLGVGAAFDFHAGLVRQAPRWIQRSGFEWLFRLCMEPRRLWKRYVVNNSAFLFHILQQITKLRKYEMVK